jgi:Fur family ferric uptake transcriptional regulator
MIASTQTNSPLAGADADTPVAIATAKLKAAGLRITQPRLTILAALVKRGQPSSIETIHLDLGKRACDLVTVYRCMAAFEEIGIVRRTYFHNGTGLYSLSLDAAHRYHVVSKATDSVHELDAATAGELHAALVAIEDKLRAHGYTDVSHIAEFFGTPPASNRVATAPEAR